MATTSPAKVRNVTALVCAVLVALIVSIGAFLSSHKPVVVRQNNTTNNITVDAIADYVIEMPESPFKKNMLTVFGAEYAGDSTELNKLLNAYSTMKLEEMEKLKGKTL
jgi:hypothetical protein